MSQRDRFRRLVRVIGPVFGAALLAAPLRGAVAPASGGQADEWPQWRGPTRDDLSHETGLLADWPKAGPPLAWEAKDLGGGFSGVAVAGGKIFTLGDAAAGENLYALNESDGKTLWSARIGPAGSRLNHPGTRSTPTVDGEFVYVLGDLGDLACFNVADGKPVWHSHLIEKLGGVMPNWGFAESPLIDGEHFICTPGGEKGTLAALDKKTGAVVWRSEGVTDPCCYSSTVPAEIGKEHQIVQLTPVSVIGVRATDGKLLWRAPRRGQTAVIPTPIVHDNFVYVTSGYGVGDDLFEIDGAGDSQSAKKIYANKVMVNHHGGVILYEGDLYGYSDNKGWTCQNFKDGEAVWKDKEALGKGAIGYADKHFYLRAEDSGAVVLIDATRDGFKEHGRFTPPDRSRLKAWPHPVIVGGKLYLRDQDVLLCYNVKK